MSARRKGETHLAKFGTGLLALIVAATLAGATAFAADPIETRKATMKAMGGAVGGVLVKMVKGEKPYDAKEAGDALAVMIAKADSIDAAVLFAKGTESGGETAASPKIWTDRAGFEANLAKLKAVLPAQSENVGKDVAGLKVAVAEIGKVCKACHGGYRLEKN